MASKFTLTLRCEGKHEQTLSLVGWTLEEARDFAGLLEGTSPLFVRPPRGTPSPIGKCATCGQPIEATLAEV